MTTDFKELLLWGNGKVNKPIGEVCTRKERGVKIASNNEEERFEVVNDATVEGAWGHTMVQSEETTGVYTSLWDYGLWPGGSAWVWEYQKSFFANFNLSPTFYDNNYTWGWWEESEQRYVGALGMVRKS